jgi:hypothetical protein
MSEQGFIVDQVGIDGSMRGRYITPRKRARSYAQLLAELDIDYVS